MENKSAQYQDSIKGMQNLKKEAIKEIAMFIFCGVVIAVVLFIMIPQYTEQWMVTLGYVGGSLVELIFIGRIIYNLMYLYTLRKLLAWLTIKFEKEEAKKEEAVEPVKKEEAPNED